MIEIKDAIVIKSDSPRVLDWVKRMKAYKAAQLQDMARRSSETCELAMWYMASLCRMRMRYSIQYYRNRLFSNLFHKLQSFMKMHVVDLPICIDACGNAMYIHVIARDEHFDMAMAIKQDVLDGFSK